MISVQPCPINKVVVPPKEIYCFSHCFPTPAGSCIKKNDSHPTKTKIITVPPLNLLKMKFCSPLGSKWLHCVWKLNKRVIVKDDWVTYVRSCLKWIFLSWRNKIQFIMKPTNIDWWRSSKLFFYSKSFRSIKWSRLRRSQSMGLPLGQQDSRFLHEIEASDQPVWDGAQTPKSHSIQKEATRKVYIYIYIWKNKKLKWNKKNWHQSFYLVTNITRDREHVTAVTENHLLPWCMNFITALQLFSKYVVFWGLFDEMLFMRN